MPPLSFPKRRISRLSDCSDAIPPGKHLAGRPVCGPGRIQLLSAGGAGTRRTNPGSSTLARLWRGHVLTPCSSLQPPARYPLHVAQSRLHPARRSTMSCAPGEATGHRAGRPRRGPVQSRRGGRAGGCAYAPTMTAASHHYVSLTHEKVDKLIDELRRQSKRNRDFSMRQQSPAPVPGISTLPACGGSGSGYRETPGLKIVTRILACPTSSGSMCIGHTAGGRRSRKLWAWGGTGGGGGQSPSARPRRRGFPAGVSGVFCPKTPSACIWCCNGDESDQGPSKTECCWVATLILPIEGVAPRRSRWGARTLSSTSGASCGVRRTSCRRRWTRRYAGGWLGQERQSANGSFKLDITVHLGAGATSVARKPPLLESIEGKRGWPRNTAALSCHQRSFWPAHCGQQRGNPMNVPTYVTRGGNWFAKAAGKSRAAPACCAVGHVKRAGVYELPMGNHFSRVESTTCVVAFCRDGLCAGDSRGSLHAAADASEIAVPIESMP